MNDEKTKNLIKLSKRKLIKMIFLRAELTENQQQQIESLKAIIKTLQTEINALQTEIQTLKKHSSNSSKPPSSDTNHNPQKNQSLRQPSEKKSGGQKGHEGTTRRQIVSPDKTVVCKPAKCSACGKDLEKQTGNLIAKRQEIDIPQIKPIITEYQQKEIICSCGHRNKGNFPDHLNSQFQIGQNLRSFIVYLNTSHHIPYNRLTQIIDAILNVKISEGTIDNVLDIFHKQGIPVKDSILQDIKKQKWTGSDETGTRVENKICWQWVWQNKIGNFYAIEPSRGYAAVKKHFGEDYAGVLIHDCWSAQNNTIAGGHQLCHPHLLRDLIFCMEAEKSKWAYEMKRLLLSSEKARDIIWRDGFSSALRTRIILEYQEKLKQFIQQSVSGKESKKLQKRFKKHSEKIFYFMNDPDIPWHNNSSERAIRNVKLHQKISGCFRSIKGAERRSVVLSIIETCKKRKLNVLNSLQKVFRGDFSFEST
jgi:transposase